MEEKIANHACMNEQFFLEFHMARSHIEMQRKRNRDGALNNYLVSSTEYVCTWSLAWLYASPSA